MLKCTTDWIAGIWRLLEPDIGRRQAAFGAAEHRGGALDIVGGRRRHGMHIAPGSLDGVRKKDGAPAARHHQPIDRLYAPIRCLAAIPAAARAELERDLFAGAG